MEMTPVSRTVGETQIVEELVIRFSHTVPIDFSLPCVPPTRKCVEMAVAVIVGFKDGKISHEHIYWNQACLLVQIGLIDPRGLAVTGVEIILKVLNPALGISPTT